MSSLREHERRAVVLLSRVYEPHVTFQKGKRRYTTRVHRCSEAVRFVWACLTRGYQSHRRTMAKQYFKAFKRARHPGYTDVHDRFSKDATHAYRTGENRVVTDDAQSSQALCARPGHEPLPVYGTPRCERQAREVDSCHQQGGGGTHACPHNWNNYPAVNSEGNPAPSNSVAAASAAELLVASRSVSS